MITGDNTLTACQVAKTLKIMTKSPLILTYRKGAHMSCVLCFCMMQFRPVRLARGAHPCTETDTLQWQRLDESVHSAFSPKDPWRTLTGEYDLCISGDSLGTRVRSIRNRRSLIQDRARDCAERVACRPLLLARACVCAHVARSEGGDPHRTQARRHDHPHVRRWCVTYLAHSHTCTYAHIHSNLTFLGTNDVGALKQAHVGVALLNVEPNAPTAGGAAPAPAVPSTAVAPASTAPVSSVRRRPGAAASAPAPAAGKTPARTRSSSAVLMRHIHRCTRSLMGACIRVLTIAFRPEADCGSVWHHHQSTASARRRRSAHGAPR